MNTDARRTITSLSELDHPRRYPTLLLAELNLLAKKIACVDEVTFAKAHEEIESFMGGVDLGPPRTSTARTDNCASDDEKKWMLIHSSERSDSMGSPRRAARRRRKPAPA
jgi:hypothetical protein